jgi:uncharacterized protein (DUF58 family)
MNPLWRVLYRFYRIVSWLRYRIPRRFAPAGRVLLGGLCAAAIVGLDTENTVAYQGFALLLFLLLVAIGFSWFFRMRFEARRVLPRFGSVGQPMAYEVRLKNLTSKTQIGLTLLEELADTRPGFAQWKEVQVADEKRIRSFQIKRRWRANPFRAALLREAQVPAIPPRGEADVRVELTPLRRGVLRFTGLVIARPDPFGLFRALRRVPAAQTTLILPKRFPLPPQALPGTMKYQEGGVALASNVGRSEEFVSLRDYRRGDPLRHIHWRSWARAGKPIVKEFEDEFFVRHALVLDTFIDHPESELFEEAVSVAASFACTIQTQESLLDLLFIGAQAYCFTAGRGLAHPDQMLEILASVRTCPDRKFSSLEPLVLGHLGLVSGCICVLLAWDDERRALVKKIRAVGVPIVVLVIVPEGERGQPDPGPMRDDVGNFHVLESGHLEEGLENI